METLQVNIHEAKTQLTKLIQEAPKGNEVIIARGNKPVVRLDVLPELRCQRKIGNAKGLIVSMADDFDEPLDDFSHACFAHGVGASGCHSHEPEAK